jgi:hypothetical protein
VVVRGLGIINTANDYKRSKNGKISIRFGTGECYDYFVNGYSTKKSMWIIPHVIKYRDDSEIITWRCSWGNSCKSNCLYAMNKDSVV